MKDFALANWSRWTEEQPGWFTANFIARLPPDMIPVGLQDEAETVRGSVRKKSVFSAKVSHELESMSWEELKEIEMFALKAEPEVMSPLPHSVAPKNKPMQTTRYGSTEDEAPSFPTPPPPRKPSTKPSSATKYSLYSILALIVIAFTYFSTSSVSIEKPNRINAAPLGSSSCDAGLPPAGISGFFDLPGTEEHVRERIARR